MGPITYDLGNATVMPGLIDVHVHLQWYFGPSGKYGDRVGAGPEYEGEQVQANAKATLLAGFTTIQSLGWAKDVPLRAAIAADLIEGPRILTSVSQIQGSRGGGGGGAPVPLTPDQLREAVRSAKAAGADVIKFFASASIRDGGKLNVTQEQADAVCGEAKAQGLRSLVHAHSSESILVAVKAGCTEIEHGLFANDEAIKAMKDANVYFDPNIGLVLQNYLANEDKYMGSGNFNAEGFASMKAALPNLPVVFKKALAAGLRMPMGTDAVAGAHGRNYEEIIARVRAGGQKPMDAIIGATSLSAESLNLGDTIGTLAPNYDADIVAVPGDAIGNIEALRNVNFVMKGGRVYKKQ
jgi:imidazolonepropionase-like amidohydrolase